MCLVAVFGIMTISSLIAAPPLAIVIHNDNGGLGRGIEQFGNSMGEALRERGQRKQQKEAERRQVLLVLVNELLEKKNVNGFLSEQDISQAALKYSVATSTKQKDAVKIIREAVASM